MNIPNDHQTSLDLIADFKLYISLILLFRSGTMSAFILSFAFFCMLAGKDEPGFFLFLFLNYRTIWIETFYMEWIT